MYEHPGNLIQNRLPEGYRSLSQLIDSIFGCSAHEFKISRIDPNADIEFPVEFFYRALRVPLKRKSSRYLQGEQDAIATFSNRGMTGFYIGRSPALLRVYDKREEMNRRREDVSDVPSVLTRLEWELRHRKCPIRLLSQLPELLEYKPFEKIELLSTDEAYDFHNCPKDDLKRYMFNHLSADYGAHEATRILNHGRNLKRDFSPILLNNEEIKAQLHRSYIGGLESFFANQPGF